MIYSKRSKRTVMSYAPHLRKYFKRILVTLSVLFNVILGGASNQTFSARQYERKRDGQSNLVWLIDTVIFFDTDHCMMSWLYWKTTKDIRLVKGKYTHEFLYSPEYEKPMGRISTERPWL